MTMDEKRLSNLAWSGFAVALVGFHWGLFFPMVKALWSSSYVLYTTGLAMMGLDARPCMLEDRYKVYLTGCDRSMDPRSS